MTEAEDDATELSARSRQAEDVTLLSKRDLSAEPVPVADEDDFTRFSPRTPGAALPDLGVDTEDATRVVRRSGGAAAPPAPRDARSGATLSPLPPGSIGGAAAERGVFGLPAEEYVPRELPAEPLPGGAAEFARPVPQSSVPDPTSVRDKRENARHKRLLTAVVVVGVTAAVMTAAILGIIALVRAG